MKSTFLQVDKDKILTKLKKNSVYSFNMRLAQVFSVDQDVIQIYIYKNIELFR